MKAMSIVFYGINNLGKTTQARMLVGWMNEIGIPAVYVKYPVYDLYPTGPNINLYLREGNPLGWDAKRFQEEQAQNRRDFEPFLKGYLDNGIWVIAEDYTGTGIAWGVANGVDLSYLEEINADLLHEDVAFLFDGERFTSGIEKGHMHEKNDELTKKARNIHLLLGEQKGWITINANGSKEAIQTEIMKHLINKLNLVATPQNPL